MDKNILVKTVCNQAHCMKVLLSKINFIFESFFSDIGSCYHGNAH